MKNNGYITYANKKKSKKTFIVVALVAVAIFVILSAVGIFLDPYSNGANKEEIYSAVAENAELKSRIFELENEIERLNEKIRGFNPDIRIRRSVTLYLYISSGRNGARFFRVPFF